MNRGLSTELPELSALASSPLAWALLLFLVAVLALLVALVRGGGEGASRAATAAATFGGRLPPASRYVAALHAWITGRMAAAEQALRQVLAADPHHVDAALLVARLERRRGRLDRALAVDRELLTRHDLSPRQRVDALAALLADALALGYGATQLAPLADALLALEPTHPEALDVAIAACRERGALAGAISRIEQAAREQLRRHGTTDGAALRAAIATQKALFLCREGDALRRRGELDAARRFYRRALRHDETHAAPYLGLAALAAAHDRIDEALGWFRRAASRAPAELLVDGLEGLDDPRAARQLETLLETALAADPGRPLLRLALVRHLRRRRDDARALAEVRRGIELGDRSPALVRAGAELLRRRGATGEALDLVLDALAGEPASGASAYGRASWRCRRCGAGTARHAWQCPRCGAWDAVEAPAVATAPAVV
ncbi:MAG: tetratricopeptide repeat protein [Candidatus Eiseniibacteriota bacterium]|jgi:lipopolysaccharide biosynthesis regulator YciM